MNNTVFLKGNTPGVLKLHSMHILNNVVFNALFYFYDINQFMSLWTTVELNGTFPSPCFGATACSICKSRIVLYGGAIKENDKFSMSGNIHIFNIFRNEWIKIERKILTSQRIYTYPKSSTWRSRSREHANGSIRRLCWKYKY